MVGVTFKTLALAIFSLLLLIQPLVSGQAAQGRPTPQQPVADTSGTQSQGQPAPAPVADSGTQSQGRPKIYSCVNNKDDGALYTTPNGVTFKLVCGHGTTAKWIDGGITVASQKACADACSELSNCQSCDWRQSDGRCVRFSQYIPLNPNPAVNTWYPLEERKQQDPRPDPEPRTPPNCPKPKLVITENTSPFTTATECDAVDTKIFVTPSGSYYQIKCGFKSSIDGIGGRALNNFGECMTACSETPGCKSVGWNGGRPTWQCTFFASGNEISVIDASKKKDFAFLIDPPTCDKPDDFTHICSTECPAADGQTWETPNGVKFHMDCCKRHGVVPIGNDQQPSFIACMATCASVLGCGSVDWHQETGQCYYGKHFGEPTIAVAGWASAHSLGCAGDCRKMTAAMAQPQCTPGAPL